MQNGEESSAGMAGRAGTASEQAPVDDGDAARSEPRAPTNPQLTKKAVFGPLAGDCGFFKWQIRWELDRKTTKGGLVIQKVEGRSDVKDCKGDAYEGKASLDPSWFPFWEAWVIDKDKTVTKYPDYDDNFQPPGILNRTKGVQSFTATAVFYEGAKLSATKLVATGQPPAGSLPMSKTDPQLKGGSNSVPHNLKATWDCCGKGFGATKATTVKTE